MLLSTTSTLDGLRTTRYLGLVAGEAILGANVFSDMFAGIRDIIGGRSGAYERNLNRAREIAIEEMQKRAERMGANAIVGVDIDYETIQIEEGGNMLMVTVSGTAVVVE